MENPEMKQEHQYLIDVAAAAQPGQGSVGYARLSSFLRHREDGQTCVLSASVGGEVYDLLLCGWVDGYDDVNGTDVHSGNGLSEDEILWLDSPIDQRDVNSMNIWLVANAWFEWVNLDGEIVGETFYDISTNPADEVRKLHELLGLAYDVAA